MCVFGKIRLQLLVSSSTTFDLDLPLVDYSYLLKESIIRASIKLPLSEKRNNTHYGNQLRKIR